VLLKANLKSMLKYVVSVFLLVIILFQMDFSVLQQQLHSIDSWSFGLALLAILCQIFFLNMRWHSFLQISNNKISFKTSSFINIAGYFANVLFITSVGGILAKSSLAVRHGLSITQAIFTTFLDRFMTLAALIVFSVFGLQFLEHVLDQRLLFMLSLSIIGVIAIVVLSLLILRSGLLKDFILSSRKRSRLIALLRMHTENYPLMFKTVCYSLIAQGCFILSVYILFLGIDVDMHIQTVEFLALLPVLALISALPISFGGWGVREGAFIYGLSLVGFSMESAFLLSVQVGVVTLIAPFLFGLPYLLQSDFKAFLLGNDKLPV